MVHKIILDCDPGHDDAIALLLAAHHPAIELLAVTTVAGNQAVEKTARNALKVCSLAGIHHIPVARGMEKPLVRPSEYAADIHGVTGLDGPHIPEPDFTLAPQHAVDLIIDLLSHSEDPITLVATGPLTNIATVLIRAPHLKGKIKAISMMGGAIGLGNTTPAAEFNIWFDPKAACQVFDSGIPITLIPLEVTHQALATPDIIQRLRASRRHIANFSADLLLYFAESYKQVFGFAAPPVHDPCAVAAVISPDIIEGQMMRVEIETEGKWSAGRTICDVYHKLGRAPNARVGTSLYVARFWDMVIDTLLTYA
ncbi:nucleoside hydrolase [Ktedonospora formicarum]|uniref:Ribosylpyrimidine nucleosidase n=1 Tax=Ktedonospora formicarum TaxID=2778364 RepID=A0A8J3I5W2_9CHLR|nr:nucleoside hydrolase [Ktedonospora formicarum]GHO50174.1 ribosylpyrimidine nucleosidase [Ktedonospora formicarum]